MDQRDGGPEVTYTKPTIEDLGDLAELTLATGSLGAEDGIGKTITAEVPGVVRLSLGLLP